MKHPKDDKKKDFFNRWLISDVLSNKKYHKIIEKYIYSNKIYAKKVSKVGLWLPC